VRERWSFPGGKWERISPDLSGPHRRKIFNVGGGEMTLVLNKATTVLPVDDAERARHFYADTLGLPHRGVADDGSELFGSEGGPMLQLMPVKDGKHSEHTALSFEVSEIERTVREMEAKGVMFQDYDLPNLKTENHICTTDSEKCAWFMDSEHNILCVHENISAMADYQL
jgi:predicted enzyme related to lactoylglutathione lyase